MPTAPRMRALRNIFIASGFIAIGLVLSTPADSQTTQQRAWCDIRGSARPDQVISRLSKPETC